MRAPEIESIDAGTLPHAISFEGLGSGLPLCSLE